MTSGGGILGGGSGYKYESPESRTLASFAADKFEYRDQAKNLIQVNNAIGFMSGMMRKMQRGIDKANQNFVQQLQSFITDFIVLLGGGGDTGLDFGDLKYVIQMIGALFGFTNPDGSIKLPPDVFGAAWHFVSTYIFPVDNFHDVINAIIDALIATSLDIFGEVPILGQAIQQLAVIISRIRDALGPLTTALDKIFGVFSGDWLSGDFGTFQPLWDAVLQFFGVFAGPILDALMPVLEVLSQWSTPFINMLTDIVISVSAIIDLITGNGVSSTLTIPFTLPTSLPMIVADFPLVDFVNNFLSFFNIGSWLSGGFNPITAAITFAQTILKPTGILAWLNLDGILPDELAPQLLSDIILAIESAFNSIPFVGFFTKPVFDAINGLLKIGQANTTSITSIQNTINSTPVSGGVSVSDDLNRDSAITLGANYDSVSFGPGVGTWGTNGAGSAHWSGGGGSSIRSWLNRHLTPLATRYQSINCVTMTPFIHGDVSPVYVKLQGRMNAAKTSWVEARVLYFGSVGVQAGYVISGVWHQIGDTVGGLVNEPSAGWEFRIGSSVDDREYRIFRNGIRIGTWQEAGATSVIDDTNNVFASHEVQAGLNFASIQVPPPDIGIFAFSDRAPTS